MREAIVVRDRALRGGELQIRPHPQILEREVPAGTTIVGKMALPAAKRP